MSKRLWGGLAVALLAALCLTPNMARADDAAPVPIDEEHFPDPAFREYVEDCDKNEDEQLSTEELAAVTKIDCQNQISWYYDYKKQLASLKGIEYFTSLTDLDCADNEIEELDLSKNTELKKLDCSVNKIKSLDLSKNTKLENVYADNNTLTSLNVRGITALKKLVCYSNDLTELDVSGITALKDLDCHENKLTELDVSGITAWLDLSCENNELTKLTLTRTVVGLNCSGNQLGSLDLSNYEELDALNCSSNRLTQLNVSGCADLRNVYCNDNRISQLDLSGCTLLATLNCSNNRLTSLGLSDCTHISTLDCSNNQLTSLDLTAIEKATDLTCTGNAYTIDVESGRTLDLTTLPGKFDATKASGWSGGTVSDGVLTVNDDAASVTYSYDCGHGQTVTFTLNAGYAVSFDTGGGSAVDSQTVAAGGKATAPEADPTWAGHAFCGWYADEGLANAFDFENTAINAGTTVYAKWEEDAEAPVISGIKDGRTYCAAQKFTVTDGHPGTVTVNGAAVELGEDGSFTLSPAAGEQKVVAADRAGNSATVTVTVNDGHTWGEGWSHDADEHWRVCSVCGEKGDVAEHAGGTATCSSEATCEVCGEEYGKLDPKNHEHTETLAAKEATCTEDGLTEGSKCTDCGEVLVEQKAVPASGHKGGTATCSKKAECETCGEEYGKLDPENHEALGRVEAKEATAEAEGNVEHWRCTGCGKLFSDAAGTTEISKADTVIPKLDPKKDEGDKTDDGNGGQGGGNGSNGGGSNDSTNGAAGGGSNASNGSADGTSGGSATKTTVTTVTAAGKAGSGLAQTGDPSAAAAGIALAAGLAALGAALLRSKRCDF